MYNNDISDERHLQNIRKNLFKNGGSQEEADKAFLVRLLLEARSNIQELIKEKPPKGG